MRSLLSFRPSCGFALALVPFACAQAQTLVITGAREPLAAERVAADVVVIDAATIRASTADSLADLLRREAGVQLSRNGGPGQSSSVLLRGAGGGQTAVFVDGVRIGSATLGLPTLATLALADIERVEVLRGPGSSLHGPDTVGGAVHVFTRTGRGAPRVEAAVAAGGLGSTQASLAASGSVSAGAGAWDYAAGLAHEASDGVSVLRPGDRFGNFNPDRDGYRLASANARIGFSPAAGQRLGLTVLASKLNARYDASEFLPPAFAQDNTPDFRNRQRTEVAALDWRGAYAGGVVATARVSRSVDLLHTGGNETARYRTARDAATAQLAMPIAPGMRVVAALEHLDEAAESSDIGFDLARRHAAAVLAFSGERGELGWQAELRRDDSSVSGGVSTGRLGAAWGFAPGWTLRALAGDTFRAPSLNDLYFPNYGVASIRPERGRSVEAGLAWRGPRADVQATAWRNRVTDLIAYEPDAARCPDPQVYAFGCARNIGRATLQGLTVAAGLQQGAWTWRANVDFVDATDDADGSRLARRAAHQAVLSAGWREGAYRAGASLLRLGARPESGKILAAETTLDLQAGWRLLSGWTAEIRLLNATDRSLEPARDFQSPGRQLWLGLRYGGAG